MQCHVYAQSVRLLVVKALLIRSVWSQTACPPLPQELAVAEQAASAAEAVVRQVQAASAAEAVVRQELAASAAEAVVRQHGLRAAPGDLCLVVRVHPKTL